MEEYNIGKFITDYSSKPELASIIFKHVKDFEAICDNILETGIIENKTVVNNVVMDDRELFVGHLIENSVEHGYSDVVEFLRAIYSQEVEKFDNEKLASLVFEKDYSKDGYFVDNLIGNFAINQTAHEYLAGIQQELEQDYNRFNESLGVYYKCVEINEYYNQNIKEQLEGLGLETVSSGVTISEINIDDFSYQLKTKGQEDINSRFAYSCNLLNAHTDENNTTLEITKTDLLNGSKTSHYFNQNEIENGHINLNKKRIEIDVFNMQGQIMHTIKTNDFSIADTQDAMLGSVGVDYDLKFNNSLKLDIHVDVEVDKKGKTQEGGMEL